VAGALAAHSYRRAVDLQTFLKRLVDIDSAAGALILARQKLLHLAPAGRLYQSGRRSEIVV
jgi:hypothetical protein